MILSSCSRQARVTYIIPFRTTSNVQLHSGTSSIPPLGLPIPDAVVAPNLPLHPHPAPNIAHLHTFRTFFGFACRVAQKAADGVLPFSVFSNAV